MPPRFHLLIATQFVAAVADNALLIVTIGLLQSLGEPAWWVPLLKLLFVSLYVLLAPLLGPLADAWPKVRWMMAANALKLLAVASMLMGLVPLAAFLVAGLGSALYAPAKYGLITEQVRPALLVRANAWLEVSVVGAVLSGTVLGGALVSDGFVQWAAVNTQTLVSSVGALFSLSVTNSGLLPSLVTNTGVRCSGARYPESSWRALDLWRGFLRDNRVLWSDRLGGLSLAVTVLCWGAGAVLQLAVLRWAVDVLGLGLDRAAYLQAVVAVGVVLGASCAGRWIRMAWVPRLVPLGVLMGLLVMLGSQVSTLSAAMVLMALVGAVGGLLIVPMNALLQHRGHVLLTAGRSVALQGFNENAGVLVMLALYAVGLRMGLEVVVLLVGLGGLLAGGVAFLWWRWTAGSGSAAAASSNSCSN
jgi:MFS transporter, LPLT family, lysophospholipid transporter